MRLLNRIGDDGAKALAAVLADTQVSYLDLHGNSIGAEGAKALAIVLADTKVTNLNRFSIQDINDFSILNS